MNTAATYIYLHGFASGPQSAKAMFLQAKFQAGGIDLIIPDLNQPDFTHFSLSRNIQTVIELLPAAPQPVILLGSSFGGLTGAWVAQQCPQVSQLILLAPAFEFLPAWLPRLGSQLHQWQTKGYLDVEHYGYQAPQSLSYDFLLDLQTYDEANLTRPVPTLIVHGDKDDVIPIAVSQRYAQNRAWVQLIQVSGDHGLVNNLEEIWQIIMTKIMTKLPSGLEH